MSEGGFGGGARGGKRQSRPQPRKRPEPFEPGTPLTEAQVARFRDRLKSSAYWYLSRGDRTRQELAQRMARKVDIPADLIPGVLDELTEDGLIDDARYAENFIRSRIEYRKLGKSAIRMELARRGVDRDIIDLALEDWDEEDETERAYTLVEKKMGSSRGQDRQKRTNSLVGMLARKGYPLNVAFGVVRELLDAEAESTNAEPSGDEEQA